MVLQFGPVSGWQYAIALHVALMPAVGIDVAIAADAIENANGLVRQYIPKSAAVSNFSQEKITKLTAKINDRPRKKLNFSTPKECFYKNIS